MVPSSPSIAASDSADVGIIGGGPAGSAAARLLADWGHRVVVLTRAPARQALAESLPPSALKLLDRIGVRAAVDAAGFVRATGNTVWWGSAEPRVERFGGGALGLQLSRDLFDELLLDEAERPGARVLRGATVGDVALDSPGNGRSRIAYERNGGRGCIDVRWVLDCTGRAGLLARRDWRRAEPGSRTLALVGVWERDGGWKIDDETHTLVESYEGGWAWSVPVSRTRRYVTTMVDPARTAVGGRDRLAAVYDAELSKTTWLRALAGGSPSTAAPARLIAAPFAREASSYFATRSGEPGVLLVGDAASFVDPLSSYGIKKALASAWLAAVVVHTSLTNATMMGAALELHDARERRMYESLRSRFAELSREAAGAHPTEFWRDRTGAERDGEVADGADEPDIAALRSDPAVLAAFEELKRRPSIALRCSPSVTRTDRPTVRGNQVVLEPHLIAPAFPEGVRWLRNVDLVLLSTLAPATDQVPDLYGAYDRAAPSAAVPLPDFLGALSVLIGKGMLDLA